MKLRKTFIASFALTFVLGVVACGDDSTGPSDLPNLAGTWTASAFAIELVDGSGAFDPISQGGALRLDIFPNGEVVTTTRDPGATELDVDVGMVRVLSVTHLELQMRANEQTLALAYVLNGNRLTLSGRFDVDVTDDGVLRPADLEAVFVRN